MYKFVTYSTPICLKYSKCTFHPLSKMHQFKLPPLVRILFNLHWYLHIFTRDPLLRHTSWHHTTAPELYTIYKHRYTCTINKSARKTKHRNLHERKSIHKHWHCMYTREMGLGIHCNSTCTLWPLGGYTACPLCSETLEPIQSQQSSDVL